MTLEEYIGHLNSLVFWREFTFAENRFSPKPGSELELADNLVWLGDRAYVLQLKQREQPTQDSGAERTWFQKKVLKAATKQIRDSLNYLHQNPTIEVTNLHGHRFAIEPRKLKSITKIIVYLPSSQLPEDCWNRRYYVSQTTDAFMHLVPAHDYLGILEKLRVPEDIARYFDYREEITPILEKSRLQVDESDIMGAFLTEQPLPTTQSRSALRHLLQDFDNFDLSRLLADVHKHIQTAENPYDYYQILREFAKSPRSVWREVKLRLLKSLEVTAEKGFVRPFRVTFPESDCTFMIAPLDPSLPAVGPEGERIRINGLSNLTAGAKYLAKTSKCVGILVSRVGEYVQIDWCLIEHPWEREDVMESWLAEANPFRPVTEKSLDGFFFIDLPPSSRR
jgi:hypothetical protein